MGEQVPCPVCTLFLHPGMSLADHLETHPKEQVIKALVSLASGFPSNKEHEIASPAQEASPIIPTIHAAESNTNILSTSESKLGFVAPSKQNVMIVNRQSTMVYQTSDTEHQRPLSQSIPELATTSNLQMFNMPNNQTKILPPPPAYGTAINQLRSQNNQNFYGRQIQLQNEAESFDYGPSNYDYARNLSPRPPSRPTSSPSVLRFAESPVTAHYVERENGDFIVQETPRHVVQCVEKDDGEFSVIEKVIRSPPCVVQFNDNENNENNENNEKHENNENDENTDQYPGEPEEVQCDNHEISETSQIIEKQQKALPGVTVLSDVKLDPTESLDIMENIIASSKRKGRLTDLVESVAEVIKKEESEKNLENIFSNHEKLKENDHSYNEQFDESCKTEEQKKPWSSAATSVIRLATQQPNTSQEPIQQKDNLKKPEISPKISLPIRRSFRKTPKKLIVKFKSRPKPSNSREIVENNGPQPGPSDSQGKPLEDMKVEISKAEIKQNEEINPPDMAAEKQFLENNLEAITNEEETEIEEEVDKKDIKLVLEPIMPCVIVHEPSAMEESDNANENQEPDTKEEDKDDKKDSELSKLLDECITNTETESYSVHLSTIESIPNATAENFIVTEFSENTAFDSQKNETNLTPIALTSSSFSKPSTSSFALRDQTDFQSSHSFNDYPFSFLYANSIDKNRLSPIYPGDDQSWHRYTAPIFQQNQQIQNQDIDGEKNSYIDLDACKKQICTDTVPLDALNIRTDEKMPAKGEISEQESNGEIDLSWSQPLYHDTQRFSNQLENYVTRGSGSYSNDAFFFYPQDLSTETKPIPSLLPTPEHEKPPESLLKKEPRKSNSAIRGKKTFQCDHCPSSFPKLRERNTHLIEQHNYKRINRRLIREPPAATVTTQDEKPFQYSGELVQPDLNEAEDVKKSDITLLSTIEASHLPKTKYDSLRVGVYRMLMNFNLSVLQQTDSSLDIDKTLFDSKSFCCFTCKESFISVKTFDKHLSEHPAECFTCGKKFTRWTYFSVHLKRHLGWKDFACSVCSKKFVIRVALIEHMRMHTGLTPLKCKFCDKQFRRYSNLTQHKRLCHLRVVKKKDYVCHCGEVLPSKARFLWHKETHDTKPKCCPHCRDRFVHSISLKRHIRLAHSDKFSYTEPAECPICNQVYAKTSIKAHMSIHSMETQHECVICNKSFSTKWNLKIHSWVHANRAAKPFKCDQCVKAFVREVDYKNHINAHKQIKPYTCEYCGCKFIRKYNYMRHSREHHGQKKFSCDLCGKLFHRHYYLIEHRRTHTGERPFLCTICGKSSTTKTNHNKHLKIHHSRDPFTSET